MFESVKKTFSGYEDFDIEKSLSPASRHLVKVCSGFEDAQVKAIGIYPEKKTVKARFICGNGREIEVEFSGVGDVSATCKGEIVTRNAVFQLPYEHDVDEFSVYGTCYFQDREKLFHTHITKLIAEDLIVMFTFSELSFGEISESQ